MPELLEHQAIALSDSPTEFTVHLKDGSTDKIELSELGSYFENNADKIEVRKFTPRRHRLPD
jgi:hypothetical protein